MDYLEELREEIDNVDKKIVELFEQRMEIVSNVAKYKIENKLAIVNNSREEEVINKNSEYLNNKDLQSYLRKFFINLMDLSKDYQNEKISENNAKNN